MVCFQLIRVLSPYISEPTLLFVLFSSSGVSLRWFIRYDANRTLVCPCFYAIAWTELIFFFFFHNNFVHLFRIQNRNWISKNPLKRINELRSIFNESSKCQPKCQHFSHSKNVRSNFYDVISRTFLSPRSHLFLNS